MKKLLIVLILFFSYDAFSQTAKDYFERAYEKDENGDYYGAISDYTKAIELKPDYAEAYHNRSISKEEIGDLKGACDDAKKAVNLGNTSSQKWLADNCN